MAEVISCDVINTYKYQLTLPASGFYTITFSCNGYTITSDTLNSVDSALMWAEDTLGDNGIWSLVGNTLYLSDSLCGVGSLYFETVIVAEEPAPDPDDPSSFELQLFSDNPQAITDIFGDAAVDESTTGERASDSVYMDALELLSPGYIEPITGTTAQWVKYSGSMDGYGIQSSEVNARGYNIHTLLGGVGAKTYGYSFFQDALDYIIQLSPQPEIIISLNLIRPKLLGSFSATYAEIDYCVSACATAGVTIRLFQLCYEMGNQSNEDVFDTAQEIADTTQTVADYINANYPSIKIGIDAANWDDEVVHFVGLSEAMNTVTGIDYVRQYLFLENPPLSSFEQNMAYTQTAVDSMVNYFNAKFTHGQKLILAQPNVVGGNVANPFRLKVGEGLIYSKLLMDVINKNLLTSDLIANFTHYNLTRMIANNNHIYASYYFVKAMRGAMNNDGKISFIFSDPEAPNFPTLAVLQGANAEVRIINPTNDFATVNGVSLDGVGKNLTVDTYYGDPSIDTATHYTSAGDTVLLYPHSLTVITTT